MTIYRFGPFRLEKEPMLLWARDTALPLGPKVVETLLALVEHPGDVLGKNDLLARVWPEGFVEEANLTQNIYVIRKALRAHWDVNAIETVPRRGYRFSAPVALEEIAAPHEPVRIHRPLWRNRVAGVLAAAMALAVGIATMQVAHPRTTAAVPRLSEPGARLYAMGTYYWNQRTKPGIAKSLRYFQAVTRTDPQDARGYAGLALSYAIEGDYGFGPLPKQAAFHRAADYGRHALSLNPNSAEALAALGLAQIDLDHAAAGQALLRRAIAADARFAPAHQWYGMSMLRDGNGLGALQELQRAANLDPDSVAATDWLAEAAYMARRYRDAISYAHQTLDLSPQRFDAYSTMGMAYEALGDYPRAIRSYQTFAQSCAECRGEASALLAHAYATMHDDSAAQKALDAARAALATQSVDPEDIVTALVAMGRRTEALRMLQSRRAQLSPGALAIDPRMDPVRGDKRFRPYTQGPG